MQRITVTLGLDPLEVIRRNLVDHLPYRCPSGAMLDSGDYPAAVEQGAAEGGLDADRAFGRGAAEGRAERRCTGRIQAVVATP